jgi:hypothetical protein
MSGSECLKMSGSECLKMSGSEYLKMSDERDIRKRAMSDSTMNRAATR